VVTLQTMVSEQMRSLSISAPSLTTLHYTGTRAALSVLHSFNAPALRHLSVYPFENGLTTTAMNLAITLDGELAFPNIRTFEFSRFPSPSASPNLITRFIRAHRKLIAVAIPACAFAETVQYLIASLHGGTDGASDAFGSMAKHPLKFIRSPIQESAPGRWSVELSPMVAAIHQLFVHRPKMRIQIIVTSVPGPELVTPPEIVALQEMHPRRVEWFDSRVRDEKGRRTNTCTWPGLEAIFGKSTWESSCATF